MRPGRRCRQEHEFTQRHCITRPPALAVSNRQTRASACGPPKPETNDPGYPENLPSLPQSRGAMAAAADLIGLEVADLEAGQKAFLTAVGLLCDRGVEDLDLGIAHSPILHNLAGPELVPPVDQVYLEADVSLSTLR